MERYNAELRAGIRRMCSWVEGAEWWDVLPDVLRGLRTLPHRVTGVSPYLLLFKQYLRLHDRLEMCLELPPSDPPTEA